MNVIYAYAPDPDDKKGLQDLVRECEHMLFLDTAKNFRIPTNEDMLRAVLATQTAILKILIHEEK